MGSRLAFRAVSSIGREYEEAEYFIVETGSEIFVSTCSLSEIDCLKFRNQSLITREYRQFLHPSEDLLFNHWNFGPR